MKAKMIATLLVSTFSLAMPNLASAGIGQSLEQVCANTSDNAITQQAQPDANKQTYQATLNQVFSASSCHGKELINSMRISGQFGGSSVEQDKQDIARSGE